MRVAVLLLFAASVLAGCQKLAAKITAESMEPIPAPTAEEFQAAKDRFYTTPQPVGDPQP